MEELSKKVNDLTMVVGKRLDTLNDSVANNEEHCQEVVGYSQQISAELSQFTLLMMRLEELSTSQAGRLSEVEQTIDKMLQTGS